MGVVGADICICICNNIVGYLSDQGLVELYFPSDSFIRNPRTQIKIFQLQSDFPHRLGNSISHPQNSGTN